MFSGVLCKQKSIKGSTLGVQNETLVQILWNRLAKDTIRAEQLSQDLRGSPKPGGEKTRSEGVLLSGGKVQSHAISSRFVMVFVIRWQSLFPYRLWTCLVALTKSDPSSGPHPSIVSWDWTPDGHSLDIWCPSCDLLWWNAFQEWLILSEDTPPHCSMASIPLLSWNSSHLTRCSLQHGSFEGIALQTDWCRQSLQLTPCFKSSGVTSPEGSKCLKAAGHDRRNPSSVDSETSLPLFDVRKGSDFKTDAWVQRADLTQDTHVEMICARLIPAPPKTIQLAHSTMNNVLEFHCAEKQFILNQQQEPFILSLLALKLRSSISMESEVLNYIIMNGKNQGVALFPHFLSFINFNKNIR